MNYGYNNKKVRYPMNTEIFTIGHSTHPIDEFIHILLNYGIERIVDVRTIPKSRYNPQFNQDALQEKLQKHEIEYIHLAGLGGLRHSTKDSINMAWKNASFRGFADYMQTPEFTKGLEELIELAKEKRVAIMCAEAVPWRCHRSLIGDALLVRDIKVEDILSEKSSQPHKLTPFAKVEVDRVTYPKEEE